MIKYNLICKNSHEFESWFSDSKEFEKLNQKKMLECIYCSSKQIKKSIMSPMVSGIKKNEEIFDDFSNKLNKEKRELIKIRTFIEKNFEFVGENLSKRVREIYYDKRSKKKLYGTVTPAEKEELAEEGIDLVSIPWVNKDN